jgi:hypothetical protein
MAWVTADLIWSVVLSLLSVSITWLAGSGRRIAWGVGFVCEVLWTIYSVTTRQWGFLISVVLFTAVYVRNWRRWGKEETGEA